MCDQCGCGHVEAFQVTPMQEVPLQKVHLVEAPDNHEHEHEHVDADGHRYTHAHAHGHHVGKETETVAVHLPLLAKNDRLAERNRGFLSAMRIYAINVVSSPGSGKTELLAKTLEMLAGSLPAAVIVGDLETANDAVRLRDKGAPVVQVTTGTVCHLDAGMIARGLEVLDLKDRRLLIIENVGNLVCPASYDLGEAARVVLISVTEGEDKPLKYPPIFHGAKLVVISKTDLLAATGFDLAAAHRNIRAVAPDADVIELSARTGEGMQKWVEKLRRLAE